jgi:hypothetical protein
MADLRATEQNRLLGVLADLLRGREQTQAQIGSTGMGALMDLILPSSRTVEKLSYGDPLFRMPTQSNIPITADKDYLAEVVGMIPGVVPAAQTTTKLSNRAADELVRMITRNPEATAPGIIQETSMPFMQAVAPKAAEQVKQSALPVIESENFKNWFGDWQADPQNASKIVDEVGQPMPVYHGSGSADIKEFDLGNYEKVQRGDWGKGIYFTPSKWLAKGYRDTAVKASDTTIKEALDKENALAKEFGTTPMDKWLDFRAGKITQEQYDKLNQADENWRAAMRKVEESDQGKVYDAYLDIKNPYYYTYGGITEPDLAKRVKDAGHDGLIIKNESGNIEEILVFDPKQIKSASENVGTFSKSTANIYRGIGAGGTGLLGASMQEEDQY